MSSLLFSEKPVPPITISLADVPLDELVGLTDVHAEHRLLDGGRPRSAGKKYVRDTCTRRVCQSSGVLFA